MLGDICVLEIYGVANLSLRLRIIGYFQKKFDPAKRGKKVKSIKRAHSLTNILNTAKANIIVSTSWLHEITAIGTAQQIRFIVP